MAQRRLPRRRSGTRPGAAAGAAVASADADEVKAVAKALSDRSDIDDVDIGVLITKITDEMPKPEDIERVRARLAVNGWPLDDPRDGEETE